jgi:hypothetical protein
VGENNGALAAAGAALLTFTVALVLVAGRDGRNPEITVLLLALTVVIAGRFGSRPGGIASAAMAATAFDFFHTKPYLSLKISNGDDIAVTFVLLAVGLVAGDLSARAARDRKTASTREVDVDTVSRLVQVAAEHSAKELEFAVKVELTDLLLLRDCYFTREAVEQPELGASGSLNVPEVVFRDDGFELPADGVAIPVLVKGKKVGCFVCLPQPNVGVGLKRRKTAVAAANLLGLALAADPVALRRTPRKP